MYRCRILLLILTVYCSSLVAQIDEDGQQLIGVELQCNNLDQSFFEADIESLLRAYSFTNSDMSCNGSVTYVANSLSFNFPAQCDEPLEVSLEIDCNGTIVSISVDIVVVDTEGPFDYTTDPTLENPNVERQECDKTTLDVDIQNWIADIEANNLNGNQVFADNCDDPSDLVISLDPSTDPTPFDFFNCVAGSYEITFNVYDQCGNTEEFELLYHIDNSSPFEKDPPGLTTFSCDFGRPDRTQKEIQNWIRNIESNGQGGLEYFGHDCTEDLGIAQAITVVSSTVPEPTDYPQGMSEAFEIEFEIEDPCGNIFTWIGTIEILSCDHCGDVNTIFCDTCERSDPIFPSGCKLCDPVALTDGFQSCIPTCPAPCPAITDGSQPTTLCGSPGNLPHNMSWFAFVASATSLELKLEIENCYSGQGVEVGIYDSCDFTECVIWSGGCTATGGIFTGDNFIVNQTYYLFIDGCEGDDCLYTITLDGLDQLGLPEMDAVTAYSPIRDMMLTDNFDDPANPENASLSGDCSVANKVTVCPGEEIQFSVVHQGNPDSPVDMLQDACNEYVETFNTVFFWTTTWMGDIEHDPSEDGGGFIPLISLPDSVGVYEICLESISFICDPKFGPVCLEVHVVNSIIFYTDNDGDGFGTSDSPTQACIQPINTSFKAGDCNDNNVAINPDAAEIPGNGIDENCDGVDVLSSHCGQPGTIFCETCEESDPIFPSGCKLCDPVALTDGYQSCNPTCRAPCIAITDGSQPSPLCGSIGNEPHNMSWFAFVATAAELSLTIELEDCFAGQGLEAGIYDSCDFNECAIWTGGCTATGGIYSSNDFNVGQTYYLFVDGCEGDDCLYTISLDGLDQLGLPEIADLTAFSTSRQEMLVYNLDDPAMPDPTGICGIANKVTVCPGEEIQFGVLHQGDPNSPIPGYRPFCNRYTEILEGDFIWRTNWMADIEHNPTEDGGGVIPPITLPDSAGIYEICLEAITFECDPRFGPVCLEVQVNNNNPQNFYTDNDGDGFGAEGSLFMACNPQANAVTGAGDCDDSNPDINPGATEIPNNGIDENCDGEDATTSTLEINGQQLQVYPNPVINVLHVDYDNSGLSYSILGSDGKVHMTGTLHNNEINVSSLPSGLFIIRFADKVSRETAILRVVKL